MLINLSITIPDSDMPDVLATLKQRYASNGVPSPSNAQAQEGFRQEVIRTLTNLTKQYRIQQVAVSIQEPVGT